MLLDNPYPSCTKLQCWVKLLSDQASEQRYFTFLAITSSFPHTPWTESIPIPFCFIGVYCRLNLSVKDLRHLFHRNSTAAYLRDVLPHFSLKSYTKVQSSRNWFPPTVCVSVLTLHNCSMKLSFMYIPDSLWTQKYFKKLHLSPRNTDHVTCLVKLYLSWKKPPNFACILAHVETSMSCWEETAKYYWFSWEESWSQFQQLTPEVTHSLPWKSYHRHGSPVRLTVT